MRKKQVKPGLRESVALGQRKEKAVESPFYSPLENEGAERVMSITVQVGVASKVVPFP